MPPVHYTVTSHLEWTGVPLEAYGVLVGEQRVHMHPTDQVKELTPAFKNHTELAGGALPLRKARPGIA